MSFVTVRFIRTTHAHHHRVPGERFSTKRPDTFAQTELRQPSNLLQSGGGPYIVAIFISDQTFWRLNSPEARIELALCAAAESQIAP